LRLKTEPNKNSIKFLSRLNMKGKEPGRKLRKKLEQEFRPKMMQIVPESSQKMQLMSNKD